MKTFCAAIALAMLGVMAAPRPAAAASQHDFLTQTEADRIRDAETANERVSLFLDFAADRLRRFEHELQFSTPAPRRNDFLNDLMNAFDACVNAASDRIDDGMGHGEDVRKGIEDMKKRGADLEAELKKIKAQGKDLKVYQDSLSDAMGDLKDDIQDAEKAGKQLALNPPVVKPHHEERR